MAVVTSTQNGDAPDARSHKSRLYPTPRRHDAWYSEGSETTTCQVVDRLIVYGLFNIHAETRGVSCLRICKLSGPAKNMVFAKFWSACGKAFIR